MGLIWGHLGVNLGSFLAYGGTLEAYLSQFDVEKLEMASVMGIRAGLVEPKSENVEKVLVFKAFLNGQRGRRVLLGKVSRSLGRPFFGSFWRRIGAILHPWVRFGITLGI